MLVHVRKVYNLCMLCMVLMIKRRKFLFQIKIGYEDMFLNLTKGSVVQVQGNCLKKCFISVRAISCGKCKFDTKIDCVL